MVLHHLHMFYQDQRAALLPPSLSELQQVLPCRGLGRHCVQPIISRCVSARHRIDLQTCEGILDAIQPNLAGNPRIRMWERRVQSTGIRNFERRWGLLCDSTAALVGHESGYATAPKSRLVSFVCDWIHVSENAVLLAS